MSICVIAAKTALYEHLIGEPEIIVVPLKFIQVLSM